MSRVAGQSPQQNTIGVVVARRTAAGFVYLLLHYWGRYWNFPKGRQEQGEDELTTALRELSEETGITKITILDGFRATHRYAFKAGDDKGFVSLQQRQAIFFVGLTTVKTVQLSDEHIGSGWFDYETALRRLPYATSRQVVRQAQQFLLKQ